MQLGRHRLVGGPNTTHELTPHASDKATHDCLPTHVLPLRILRLDGQKILVQRASPVQYFASLLFNLVVRATAERMFKREYRAHQNVQFTDNRHSTRMSIEPAERENIESGV